MVGRPAAGRAPARRARGVVLAGRAARYQSPGATQAAEVADPGGGRRGRRGGRRGAGPDAGIRLPNTVNAGSSSPATTPRPRRTAPPRQTTPTTGNLQLAQFQVGDCLTGANLQLNPDAVAEAQPGRAVQPGPHRRGLLRQQHLLVEERRLSRQRRPSRRTPPPSATARSSPTWASRTPSRSTPGPTSCRTQSTWPGGDRGLHCVAYYATTAAAVRRDPARLDQGHGQVGLPGRRRGTRPARSAP